MNPKSEGEGHLISLLINTHKRYLRLSLIMLCPIQPYLTPQKPSLQKIGTLTSRTIESKPPR